MNSITYQLFVQMKTEAPNFWFHTAMGGLIVLKASIEIVYPQYDMQEIQLEKLMQALIEELP